VYVIHIAKNILRLPSWKGIPGKPVVLPSKIFKVNMAGKSTLYFPLWSSNGPFEMEQKSTGR